MHYANAREFLAAVQQRYRTLAEYSDHGSCTWKRAPQSALTFQTHYRHPGHFRFAFDNPHPFPPLAHIVTRTEIGSDEEGAYIATNWNGVARREATTLEMAVAGATGISMGTAHTISALLFREVGGFQLDDLRRLRFRRLRLIDGTVCRAISGLHTSGRRISAWFGAEDLLLRQLEWHGSSIERHVISTAVTRLA